ncbi:Crp/Fnr family transcriptional regulator [Porphyrobacter sp. ULC335]|uniref:Crp/Fnr family transcriptional regulator n=1 Tax=Porphyrobacter sp. ULC335 TaxID=2854260 RepID=UPI00221F7BA4|nr:Crp/Fnr family transcriptional regulator [Porphyrobacter sp. ULC335]UYV15755.1 Crp/Fnr family transcriptional regulator [Porphyrobacter sp. ULC335]
MQTLTSAGIESLFRLLGRYMPLNEADREALSSLEMGPICTREARSDIASEGENPTAVRLLVSGWACRYKDLPDGRRQIVGFFLPGDFCDLNIYILSELDHSIGALTNVRYYDIQPHQFQEVLDERPHLLRALLWHEMVSAGIQREWLLSIGQRSPMERLAHLFVELYYRLQTVGLATGLSFDLPITQNHLAEANGLSLVHLNRTLQEMRREELIELSDKQLRIVDLDRLKRVAMFNSNYLHFNR